MGLWTPFRLPVIEVVKGAISGPSEDKLLVVTPAGAIQEADDRIRDGELLQKRAGSLDGGTPQRAPDFWTRARSTFYATAVTPAQIDVFKINKNPDTAAKAAEPALEEEKQGTVHAASALPGTVAFPGQVDDGDKGARSPPKLTRCVSEEKMFVEAMRAEWLDVLREEIILLKVERQNELLLAEQKAAHLRRSSQDKLPHRRTSLSNNTTSSYSFTTNLPIPSAPPLSSRYRTPPALPPVAVPSENNTEQVFKLNREVPSLDVIAGGVKKGAGAAAKKHRSFIRSRSSVSGSKGKLTKGEELDEVNGVVEKGGTGAENGPVERLGRVRSVNSERARECASGVAEREAEREDCYLPASPAAHRAQQAALQRRDSGIAAAAAAAEAAHTGGRRIRRIWNKIKTITGSSRKHDISNSDSKIPFVCEGGSLSTAVCSGDFAPEHRAACWLALSRGDSDDDLAARSHYAELVKVPVDCEAEILRDVPRTFPKHPLLREKDGPGQRALHNVMKAYAAFDKEVGYCQGMAFIAAVLLMHMGEEDAFCVLVYLMHRTGIRATFLTDMEQLQVRLYQMTQLVQECLPKLHAHMDTLGIKPVMYAAPWFLTLFASCLPLSLVFRVFDIILAERSYAFIFKLAIVLMQVSRRQLLQCSEVEYFAYFIRTELVEELQAMPRVDLEELVAKALRVELSFEAMLRLETEYELLAEEAAVAAREVGAAAVASQAAVVAWERSRIQLEQRLCSALDRQAQLEAEVSMLREGLRSRRNSGSLVGMSGELREIVAQAEVSVEGSVSRGVADGGVQVAGRSSVDIGAEDCDADRACDWGHLTTSAVLKKVLALRAKKDDINRLLAQAEQVLEERIKEENTRVESVETAQFETHSLGLHARRASWTSG